MLSCVMFTLLYVIDEDGNPQKIADWEKEKIASKINHIIFKEEEKDKLTN